MNTIVGVFNNRSDAEKAIQELRELNITDSDISFVRASSDGDIVSSDSAGNAVEKTSSGIVSGATTGGIIGTIAGLAIANGILPGLGTLLVAGPLATALGLTGAAATTAAGAMTGAAAGGLVGALGGLGVSASDATEYEHSIKEGNTLVTTRTDNYDQDEIETIFNNNDAKDVRMYSV